MFFPFVLSVILRAQITSPSTSELHKKQTQLWQISQTLEGYPGHIPKKSYRHASDEILLIRKSPKACSQQTYSNPIAGLQHAYNMPITIN